MSPEAQNRLLHPLDLRAPTLDVRVDARDGTLRLSGTLDQHTVAPFHAAVSKLLDEVSGGLAIDVAELDACDVTGLRALSVAYRRTLVHDRHVVVTGAPQWLCRALHRLRLDAHVLEDGRAAG